MKSFSLLKNIRVAFFLTFRSIVKGNRGTLIMVIIMMAMVFNNLIFVTSIMNGLVATAQGQLIDYLTGHIVIEPKDGDQTITHADSLQKKINQTYGVRASSIRNDVGAEIEYKNRRSRFQITAVDPAAENRVTKTHLRMIEGSYLEKDDTDSLIIGVQIAGGTGGKRVELESYSLKGVHAGDRVTVTYYNGFSKEYTVKGIFDANFVQADLRSFISQKEFESLFPDRSDQASQILIRLPEEIQVHTMIQTFRDEGIKENIRTWEDTAGIIKSVTDSFEAINILISSITLVVAGITIFIVIYVDILNRRKDIGILRAIGIKEQAIGLSYILRAFFYAIAGTILGYFFFDLVVTPYFIHNPLHLPLGDVSLLIRKDYLYMRALSLFVASFLGAYIPVRQALRIKIIDAIWGE